MVHVKRKDIELYVNHQLHDKRREEMEQHLDSCDQCFQLYLDSIEDWPIDIKLSDTFTDVTVDKIVNVNVLHQMKKNKSSSYQPQKNKTVIHYFLAAGLTILLMMTGVFQGALAFTDKDNLEKQPSITNGLMQKTDHLLDKMTKGDYAE